MTHALTFRVEGPPRTWKRTKDHKGRRLTDALMRQYKRTVAWAAREALAKAGVRWPTDREYVQVVRVYRKRKHRSYPGDRDNYGKIVQDALEGILWDDDRRVVDGRDVKLCDDDERLEVDVRIVEGEVRFED